MDNEINLDTAICPICGRLSKEDKVLSKRMSELPEGQKVNHYELCPLHKEKFKQGYIALIVINEERSVKTDSGNISINGAFRTGEYIHMQRKYFDALFDSSVNNSNSEITFINEETAKLVKKKIRENNPNA